MAFALILQRSHFQLAFKASLQITVMQMTQPEVPGHSVITIVLKSNPLNNRRFVLLIPNYTNHQNIRIFHACDHQVFTSVNLDVFDIICCF